MTFTDIVIVPGAPLLLPEYQGRAPAAPGLLEACVAAVRAAVEHAAQVVVVHATDREPRSSKPAIGARVADHLLAAKHLGFEVQHVPVPWDASVAECTELGRALTSDLVPAVTATDRPPARSAVTAGPKSLVVVADGSARRTEKAPGHLDPRAAGVDEAIVDAIRCAPEGGLERLLDLDPDLCAELLVAGRAPLQVLAAACSAHPSGGFARRGDGTVSGERTAYGVASFEVSDPFGVLYVVAHLTADHTQVAVVSKTERAGRRHG